MPTSSHRASRLVGRAARITPRSNLAGTTGANGLARAQPARAQPAGARQAYRRLPIGPVSTTVGWLASVQAAAVRFLVVVRADNVGRVISGDHWKSEDSELISWSECDSAQELMLLMQPFGWIRTDRGLFVFRPDVNGRGGRLVLE